MFVDELNALKGSPRNERATAIYRSHWLSTHRDDDPEGLPHIVGAERRQSRSTTIEKRASPTGARLIWEAPRIVQHR